MRETLTADVAGISDSDGLANAIFTYQWIRNAGTFDSNIQDATSATYTLDRVFRFLKTEEPTCDWTLTEPTDRITLPRVEYP